MGKADLTEVQQLVQSLDVKFEDSFTNIESALMRKASADELAFYRKENQFKVGKDDLEIVRRELNDRYV